MNCSRIAAVAIATLAGLAHADTAVSLAASTDAAVQYSGVLGYSVVDGETTNITSMSGGNNVRHTVYEFPLGAIPSGATITSVTLHLTTQGLISNTSSTADVSFYAYSGDGAVTTSDHGNLTSGTFVADETYSTGGTGVPSGTTLDIAFDDLTAIQAAVDGSASHLTVRSQTFNFVTFRIVSLEGAAGAAGIFPVLDITYVPAPGAAMLLGMGGMVAARRRR